MGKTNKNIDVQSKTRRRAPAFTSEGRESQLENLAMALAEKQMEEGTASSAVLVHFLRASTEKAKLERVKLEAETKLALAKAEAIQSQKKYEEIAEKALRAMKSYAGISDYDEDNNEQY